MRKISLVLLALAFAASASAEADARGIRRTGVHSYVLYPAIVLPAGTHADGPWRGATPERPIIDLPGLTDLFAAPRTASPPGTARGAQSLETGTFGSAHVIMGGSSQMACPGGQPACPGNSISAMPFNSAGTRVLTGDYGGRISAYLRRYDDLPNRTEIVISGSCASACTLVFMRDDLRLCVTRQARFGFHETSGTAGKPGSQIVATGWLKAQYPDWVVKWIDARGGLTAHVQWMSFNDMRKHMPTCA
jgi:hypothetical protein